MTSYYQVTNATGPGEVGIKLTPPQGWKFFFLLVLFSFFFKSQSKMKLGNEVFI